MQQNSKTRCAAGALIAAATLTAAGVQAHPVPALSPDFGAPECITVVDKRTTPSIAIDYINGFDDVAEEPDHIPVPEQKTHQFFAFRGQVSGSDPEYFYWPFDPMLAARARMPVWIDQGDLQECAAKNTPMIAPDFSPEKIGGETLSDRPDMMNQWVNVREMRVPITERQALLGLMWPLADVAAGVYQVVGYIYSPPYNAWEARPGVIKVIDGTRDVPAITVNSVDAMLFEGQGRKVTGCVDAPAGTEIKAYFRDTATPGAAWTMWGSQPSDDTGKFELCYRSPMPGYSGIVEVQVVAVSPQGETTAAYAPDQLVIVPSSANCTPSAKFCCDSAAAGAAGAAASSVSMNAASTGTIVQGATMTGSAGSAGSAMPPQPNGATAGAPAIMETPKAPSSGCSVNTRGAKPENADVWCALLLLLTAAGVRLRTRPHRA